jgi:hypothetical protein
VILRSGAGNDAGARRVGIEHEYQLFDLHGQVDARALWPSITFDGSRLDPGDANAVRCRWGGVATTDGREAEIATPPVRLGAGGLERAVALADVGASALAELLPDGVRMRGFSTHLNVEVQDRRGCDVARTIAQRMAPALMLTLDDAGSPGLLVRPRHRRLEIGGEFQRGDTLTAALVLAAGAVLSADAARSRRAMRSLPPLLDLRIVSSPQRYGWYVDRSASGHDLYERGRSTPLRTDGGRTIRAQEVLDATWEVARPLLVEVVSPQALALVDDVVRGTRPVPCEVSATAEVAPAPAADSVTPPPSVLDVRQRDACTLTTVAATWHAVTLRVERDGAVRWIEVPGARIDEFLTALDDGLLDEWLPTLFGRRVSLRWLRRLAPRRGHSAAPASLAGAA